MKAVAPCGVRQRRTLRELHLLTHNARSRPDGLTKNPQMHRQDQRRTLAQRLEETRVCWRSSPCGAQLQKATPGLYTHSSNGPTATTWHSSRTTTSTALYDHFLKGNQLGGRPFYCGDIQAPALGITTHHSFLLFLEERPQPSQGTSDNSLLLDSSWLTLVPYHIRHSGVFIVRARNLRSQEPAQR